MKNKFVIFSLFKNIMYIPSTLRLLFILVFLLTVISCGNSTKKEPTDALKQNNLSNNLSIENRLNAFVDISHLDDIVDLAVAKEAGLVGFFHKATQGANFVDNRYGERVQEGRKLNLLISAYHFGTGEDVEKQVDAFLAVINKYDSKGVVPVLDWESNPVEKEGTMSKEQATNFIELFFKKTETYPMIYGGYWMLNQLGGEEDIESFSKTTLWQGFYSSTFGYLDGIWSDWAFIQYTDGKLGPEPHQIEGIGPVDRSFFNGTLADVKNFWDKHSLQNNSD